MRFLARPPGGHWARRLGARRVGVSRLGVSRLEVSRLEVSRLEVSRLEVKYLGSERERDAERGAAARCRLDAYPAAMRHDESGHDSEPEPRAAGLPGPGLIGTVKPLESAL